MLLPAVAIVAGLIATALVIAALLHIARRLRAGFEAIERLAASAESQGAEMRRLGDVSAQSVRIASGAYVFELRDRFDAALGLVQIGVAESAWNAVHADGSEADEPLELVVFEPGDRARVRLRFVLSQAPVRRSVSSHWLSTPPAARVARPIALHAASGVVADDGAFELPSDLSLTADAWLDLDLRALGLGPVDVRAQVALEVTDIRPEGAVSTIVADVRLRCLVVAERDGMAIDVPTAEAEIRPEERSYFLVKSERLALDLPRVAAVL